MLCHIRWFDKMCLYTIAWNKMPHIYFIYLFMYIWNLLLSMQVFLNVCIGTSPYAPSTIEMWCVKQSILSRCKNTFLLDKSHFITLMQMADENHALYNR